MVTHFRPVTQELSPAALMSRERWNRSLVWAFVSVRCEILVDCSHGFARNCDKKCSLCDKRIMDAWFCIRIRKWYVNNQLSGIVNGSTYCLNEREWWYWKGFTSFYSFRTPWIGVTVRACSKYFWTIFFYKSCCSTFWTRQRGKGKVDESFQQQCSWRTFRCWRSQVIFSILKLLEH